MNISVLGCGRWGSFIAWYLDKINLNVSIWGREGSKRIQELQSKRGNSRINYSDRVNITTDLAGAISFADILIISISCQHLRDLIKDISSNYKLEISQKPIVLCMKGLEQSSGKRLSEVVGEFVDNPVAVWVGPGHVEDFTQNIPNCMVIDSEDKNLKSLLIKTFSSDLIKFYYGKDLIGTEIGAASKNVIGIAAGILDGLKLSSLKGALMSRATREIARLIKAMGGNEMSAYGLAHLGDYQATLFSEYSHNRMFGERFVNSKNYNELAEGASTTEAICKLGEKYQVDLPICKAVYSIIYNNSDAISTIKQLFAREAKSEF